MLYIDAMIEIVKRAAAIIGGTEEGATQALADALRCSRQALSQWERVPRGRVLELEELTGIPRHEIRPDLYPPPPKSRPAARRKVA